MHPPTIGAAVVGTGILGSRHARVYHESNAAHLVAVCDHHAERAEAVAARHGAQAFCDHREMFERLGPSGVGTLAAVSVATPDDAHVEIVCDALAAGLDVLVEKPLAMSLADADAMIEAAERSKCVLTVNYSQRWLPEHRAVGRALGDGSLGEVAFIESHRWDAAWVPQRMIGGWAHRTTPIHFMSSHDIDLILDWLGDRVVRVTAMARRGGLERTYGLTGVVDGYVAMLQFARGAVATLHSSWLLPETFPVAADATLEVHGERGAIWLGTASRELRLYAQDRAERVTYTGPATATEVNGRIEGAFTESVQTFLAAVRGRTTDLATSARRTRHVVEVQEAIVRSASEGSEVRLDAEGR